MRIGLISCCKTKLTHPAPAEELYCSDLFKLSKTWITKRVDKEHGPMHEWAILSAKHGLVLPHQVLEPYDLSLNGFSWDEKKAWAERVHGQLMTMWGDQVIYRILAGAEYRLALSKMPMVEDVIGCWTQWRKDRGMTSRRAAIGIGVLKKLLKEDTGYY